MRELMQAWVSEMEEKYGIKIISYNWFYYNGRFEVLLSGEQGFGKLPGEPTITGEAHGNIYYSLIFDGVEYIHLVPVAKEESNDNN